MSLSNDVNFLQNRFTPGADKSLARAGRKQANVSVRLALFLSAPCLTGKRKLYYSSRLDVVEIARVTDILPKLFPSWTG